MRVSIIIPNWNGLTHLPPCLDALDVQTYPDIEVIVVDNASADGSQVYLAEREGVRLIALDENRGFAGACNVGMEAADGEIIALLNNDTEVEPDWVEQVVAAFERHPEAGSVASKMLLFDQRDTLHTAGDFMRINGIPGNRGVWQTDGPAYNREEEVFGACGGSSAYRREMLDQIGLLDEDFFFSIEDVDLAWRAQLAGWKCIYVPKAVLYHHLSATGGGVTASYYTARNIIWLIAKNYPGKLLAKHWPQVLGGQWGRFIAAIKAWRGEAARATLRGMLAGIATLATPLSKRGTVQAMRTVSLERIENLLHEKAPE